MTSARQGSLDLVPTGVPGLDYVLRGGIVRGGFYLVQGHPGSGKTTVALQYARACTRAGERCVYVTLTESLRDLDATCRTHGWNMDGIDVCDLTEAAANLVTEGDGSVFNPADTELSEITQLVIAEVERVKPRHLVFDGLSELRLLSGDALRYRRQLLSLKAYFAHRDITVLMLDDSSSKVDDMRPETVVGGNIVLDRHMPEYGRGRRRLHVTKVRGWHFREGYHDYEIVDDGVVVHPRLVAADHHQTFAAQVHPSGISNLDTMLAGGLSRGTTTLLLGPAGVGKSTVAMQFVVQALKSGTRAAVYAFDEVLATMIDRSDKLCLGTSGGLRAFVNDGLLHLQQVDAAEVTPGSFAHEVRRAVEAGARIVVIDSLNGYLTAMPEERFLATHLHELFSYLNQRGVLTILTVAQHGMVIGGSAARTDVDVSYLADTVLLFRYFEAEGEIRGALGVFKKRDGSHERSLRQLEVTAAGIKVGEPLRAFRGIMTGVPQYNVSTGPVPHAGEVET